MPGPGLSICLKWLDTSGLQVFPPFGLLGGLVGDLAAFPAGGSSPGGGSWRAADSSTATLAGTGGGGAVAFMAGRADSSWLVGLITPGRRHGKGIRPLRRDFCQDLHPDPHFARACWSSHAMAASRVSGQPPVAMTWRRVASERAGSCGVADVTSAMADGSAWRGRRDFQTAATMAKTATKTAAARVLRRINGRGRFISWQGGRTECGGGGGLGGFSGCFSGGGRRTGAQENSQNAVAGVGAVGADLQAAGGGNGRGRAGSDDEPVVAALDERLGAHGELGRGKAAQCGDAEIRLAARREINGARAALPHRPDKIAGGQADAGGDVRLGDQLDRFLMGDKPDVQRFADDPTVRTSGENSANDVIRVRSRIST
jgi:hypothetical protein